MKRVMLEIAYDGTNYCGWQVQPNGITVQEVINQKLSELLKEPIETIGASRTDAGVHALGNVAVFDTSARMPGEKISYALNQRLPEDIRIQMSKEVEPDFHPRYRNSRKTYEYRILNKKFPVPTKRLYSHFTYLPLDVEKMRKAGEYLLGEHDFKSFCGAGAQVKTTVRTIYDFQIKKEDDEICMRITGSGFLYKQVRNMVGTLLKIGNGRMPIDQIDRILESGDRSLAGPTAASNGLYLKEIIYDD